MFKVVIVTDVGDFTVYNHWSANATEAWAYTKDTLKSGMPFEGDCGLFSIEPGAAIKAITVIPITDGPIGLEEESEPFTPHERTGIFNNYTSIRFLGNPLSVYYLEGITAERRYFILARVDEQEPIDVVGGDKHAELIRDILIQRQDIPADYEVVVPPSSVGGIGDYEDYLQDYISEVEAEKPYEAKDKNCGAWKDWRANHE